MRLSNCRLCGSSKITQVVDLGLHPLADTFLTRGMLEEPEMAYPLELASCGDCGHVFTLYAISPEERYQRHDYSYDSSNSRVAVQHFREFAEAVIADQTPASEGLIVDAGSNVGTLLGHFRDLGFPKVLGVEPSRNIAKIAIGNGVPTANQFFSAAAVPEILSHGRVRVLLSANVVNHADDLGDFVRTAKAVLAPDGVFVFEVPYLLDLVRQAAFDTIYHEHVHYHALRPLSGFLNREGFSIYRVDRLDYMCGSIRVYARLGGHNSGAVEQLISDEVQAGLYELATYAAFMQRVRHVKSETNRFLWNAKAQGADIIAIGAATKGNTFLNYCRLDRDLISYVTDPSDLKIGKFTPGSRIPIVSDEDIRAGATHALILPWNIADFLREKLAHLGLEFYVPQLGGATADARAQ